MKSSEINEDVDWLILSGIRFMTTCILFSAINGAVFESRENVKKVPLMG